MRKTIMWVSVVALAVTGCHKASSDSRVNVASGVRSDSAGNNIIVRPVAEFVSVVVGDGIEITDLKERHTPQDLLEIQLSGYNHAMSRRKFDYRVEWLDGDGIVLNSIMTKWITFSAMPRSSFAFRAISPNARAADFRINTRPNTTVQ
jgi:uncharacterized protein YcfL